jgi:hypothetical protein
MGLIGSRMRCVGVITLASVGLGSCNMAVSTKPLLTAGRPAATLLAPGQWISTSGDCHVRSRSRSGQSRSCSDRFEVRGGRIIDGSRPVPSIVAQLPFGARVGIAQIDLGASTRQSRTFGYVGFKVETRTRDGRISRFVVWPVLCRVPATSRKSRPLPNLVAHTNDDDCDASSREAIETAATKSRPTAPKTDFRRIR